MKFLRQILPWMALVLLAILAWFFWPKREPARTGKDFSQQERSAAKPGADFPNRPADHQEKQSPEEKSQQASVKAQEKVRKTLEEAMEKFSASKSMGESAEILKQLRKTLRASGDLHRDETVAAILDFLKSGKDMQTLLPFTLAGGGVLDMAPTLRCALLDLLPSIDPSAALDFSREIISKPSSPDEYALALRNISWNDLDDDLREEFRSSFEKMLAQKSWLADPSAGFLEAFDAAPKLGDKRAFGEMLQLNSKFEAKSPISRASFIALDRMALQNPSLLVSAFQESPTLSGASPDLRASLMSRLDLADPAQREVFSQYLPLAATDPQELEYFLSIFPNGNQLSGNWLVSSGEPIVSIEDRQKADRAALEEIEKMIAQKSDDQKNVESLKKIRDRLKEALDSAEKDSGE